MHLSDAPVGQLFLRDEATVNFTTVRTSPTPTTVKEFGRISGGGKARSRAITPPGSVRGPRGGQALSGTVSAPPQL